MRAVNERGRQFELRAQPVFDACHTSIVRLMVIAGEMQHAVQHQNFQLAGQAVAVALSVIEGDLGGDGDVAAGRSRERKHVSRLIFSAEAAVEVTQARVAGDQDIHFSLDLGEFLRASGKALKLRSA